MKMMKKLYLKAKMSVSVKGVEFNVLLGERNANKRMFPYKSPELNEIHS